MLWNKQQRHLECVYLGLLKMIENNCHILRISDIVILGLLAFYL